MKTVVAKTRCALALVVGGMLAIGPAMADKPSWAGGGKGGKDGDQPDPSAPPPAGRPKLQRIK